jgi:hypothetical protein
VKNSKRRNHARGTQGRPGAETQGPAGQTAGQSGKAAAQGDGPAGRGGSFRRRYAGTQSLHEGKAAERREAGGGRNLPGNLAVAQSPALRKTGKPSAHQPVRHGVSRWIQCEHAISEYGFLAKHPTTNAAIASPYVTMSQNYMKQVNQIWYQIYQVVKENCSVEFSGNTPQDDVMERLLRSRKGVKGGKRKYGKNNQRNEAHPHR